MEPSELIQLMDESYSVDAPGRKERENQERKKNKTIMKKKRTKRKNNDKIKMGGRLFTCSTVSRILFNPTFKCSCCSSRSDLFSLNNFTWNKINRMKTCLNTLIGHGNIKRLQQYGVLINQ